MEWSYLSFLLLSIIGMGLLDWRHRLAFWYDKRRTAITMLVGVGVFIIWDLLAIRQGIFLHGGSEYMLPLTLLPEFPLEEIFFLFLLCYSTLIIYRGGTKLWPRT